jgi:hypothetical protein
MVMTEYGNGILHVIGIAVETAGGVHHNDVDIARWPWMMPEIDSGGVIDYPGWNGGNRDAKQKSGKQAEDSHNRLKQSAKVPFLLIPKK